MNRSTLPFLSLPIALRVAVCIMAALAFAYAYIDKQNELTQVRLLLPLVAKELKAIHAENVRLQYQIDSFENPAHLMALARKSEFCYLKPEFYGQDEH
jgi:hypothetical protein